MFKINHVSFWNKLKSFFGDNEMKKKDALYSNRRQFAVHTVNLFTRQISSILFEEYLKKGYMMDVSDTDTGIVFLQIIHPMYIKGYGKSYKVGIFLPIEYADEAYRNIEVVRSIGMDRVGQEEGLDTYYKVYELDEKNRFENELEELLLHFYKFDAGHRFTFAFQTSG